MIIVQCGEKGLNGFSSAGSLGVAVVCSDVVTMKIREDWLDFWFIETGPKSCELYGQWLRTETEQNRIQEVLHSRVGSRDKLVFSVLETNCC